MPSVKVAHIREQGVDMIIAPLDRNFEYTTEREKQATVQDLQFRAGRAGLAGTAILMWDRGNGQTGLMGAPPNWRPFFESFGLWDAQRSINKEIRW